MASPNEKDKEETVITVDKAISKYNEERDKTGLVTLYNQHGKNINKLMEDLKASKPDEREKIQKQLNDVTSAQEALTAFMNKNNITIPLGGFEDQVKSIQGWEEVFDTMQMMLTSNVVSFKILKYAPLASVAESTIKNLPAPSPATPLSPPDLPPLPDAHSIILKASQAADPSSSPSSSDPPSTDPNPSPSHSPSPSPSDPPTPIPAPSPSNPEKESDDKSKEDVKPKEEDGKSIVKKEVDSVVVPPNTTVGDTWDGIREGIRGVLAATKTQIETIQEVLTQVATLTKNYNTNFITLISSSSKYGLAVKKIHLLAEPTKALEQLVAAIALESTNHLEMVIGQGRVLIKQVGQQAFNSMFLTIAFCEGEKQKAYGILRTVYDTYLEASNKASAIAGELAGLTAHIHGFAEQSLAGYRTLFNVFSAQYDALDKVQAEEISKISAQLAVGAQQIEDQRKAMDIYTQQQLAKQAEEIKAKRQALEAKQKEQMKVLEDIPRTRQAEKVVVKKHLWGLFSTSSVEKEQVSNTIELDAQQQKLGVYAAQAKAITEEERTRMATMMEVGKEMNSIIEARVKSLQDQANQSKEKTALLFKQLRDDIFEKREQVNKHIDEITKAIAEYQGGITTKTQNLKDQNMVALNLKTSADDLAEKTRLFIKTQDETIAQARKGTNDVLSRYGAQPNSDPAIAATLELLGYLLQLPKSITDTSLSLVYFRFKVLRFVRDLQVGIDEITTGSNDIATAMDPEADMKRWVTFLNKLGSSWTPVAEAMAADGITYTILKDLDPASFDEMVMEYMPSDTTTAKKRALLIVLKKRLVDYGSVAGDAETQVRNGIIRVYDQLKVLGAFAQMVNELTSKKKDSVFSLTSVDESKLVNTDELD